MNCHAFPLKFKFVMQYKVVFKDKCLEISVSVDAFCFRERKKSQAEDQC